MITVVYYIFFQWLNEISRPKLHILLFHTESLHFLRPLEYKVHQQKSKNISHECTKKVALVKFL